MSKCCWKMTPKDLCDAELSQSSICKDTTIFVKCNKVSTIKQTPIHTKLELINVSADMG